MSALVEAEKALANHFPCEKCHGAYSSGEMCQNVQRLYMEYLRLWTALMR